MKRKQKLKIKILKTIILQFVNEKSSTCPNIFDHLRPMTYQNEVFYLQVIQKEVMN